MKQIKLLENFLNHFFLDIKQAQKNQYIVIMSFIMLIFDIINAIIEI